MATFNPDADHSVRIQKESNSQGSKSQAFNLSSSNEILIVLHPQSKATNFEAGEVHYEHCQLYKSGDNHNTKTQKAAKFFKTKQSPSFNLYSFNEIPVAQKPQPLSQNFESRIMQSSTSLFTNYDSIIKPSISNDNK